MAMDTYSALRDHAVSSQEWCRVARSFYRVEIYRHLFKRRGFGDEKTLPDFDFYEQNEVYYRSFSAFELEQLACMSEFLFQKVSTRKPLLSLIQFSAPKPESILRLVFSPSSFLFLSRPCLMLLCVLDLTWSGISPRDTYS